MNWHALDPAWAGEKREVRVASPPKSGARKKVAAVTAVDATLFGGEACCLFILHISDRMFDRFVGTVSHFSYF